jgi:adenosylmethionine-8-amino-7-oxononanoate aminotransferase
MTGWSNIAYDAGLIVYSRRTRGGSRATTFLVCPPMIATETHVEEIIDRPRPAPSTPSPTRPGCRAPA